MSYVLHESEGAGPLIPWKIEVLCRSAAHIISGIQGYRISSSGDVETA